MDDVILNFIEEIKEDYRQYGKDKDVEVWLKEALKRHIPDISDEEAEKVKNELLAGIKEYREKKAKKISLTDYLKEKGVNISNKVEEITKKISEFLEDFFASGEINENKKEEVK